MIDTVIFDLDGTLLNTLEDLTDSVNYAMEKMNVPPHTAEEVRMMVGNSAVFLIKCAMPQGSSQERLDTCLKVFEEHYHANLRNKTAPYDGVMQMLADVKAKGYKTAVVSNKGDLSVKELVKDFFGDYASVAIGRSADLPRKPAPDTVWRAVELLGSQRENCVYVGDSEVDCLTAQNAGMPCVSCLWGFRDRETLEQAGATCFISAPTELIGAVEKLQNK